VLHSILEVASLAADKAGPELDSVRGEPLVHKSTKRAAPITVVLCRAQ
jgi:hypothetical protein